MVELEMILEIIQSNIFTRKIKKAEAKRGRGHAQGHEISSLTLNICH